MREDKGVSWPLGHWFVYGRLSQSLKGGFEIIGPIHLIKSPTSYRDA